MHLSWISGPTFGLLLLAAKSYADGSRERVTGCTLSPNTKKHQSFNSSGGLRHFLVDLPQGYSGDKPHPLIVSYHGHGSSDAYQESTDGLSDASATGNTLEAIVVYPNGVKGTDDKSAWEGAPYAQPGVSDLNFTADLLQYMRRGYCIDDSRIYAAGKSNGAGFVDLLACSPVGGQFAAFAMSSAALYAEVTGPYSGARCQPARIPTPILETHGTADTTIPYDGGVSHGVKLPAISSWLSTWATRNGCSGSPSVSDDNGVTHTAYLCGQSKATVQGYLINGLGHEWPNATNSPSGFQATPRVERFFLAHTIS